MKTLQKISVGTLICFTALLTNLNFTSQAQTNRVPHATGSALVPIFTNNPYAIYVISNLLTEPEPELSVPEISRSGNGIPGTFWTLKGAPAPLPFDPFPDLPVYELNTNGSYLIDDRSVDYPAYNAMMEAEAEAEGLTNPPITLTPINTNGLWLEVPSDSLADTNYFKVILHNTIEGQSYDFLTTESLSSPITWAIELTTNNNSANEIEVELPMNGRPILFVRGRVTESYSFYINMPPMNQDVVAGDTVTFTVDTGGNTNLTFQWTFDGTAIDGATNSSYTAYNVQYGDAGYYACIISDGTNSLVTPAAQLTVESGTGDVSQINVLGARQNYTFKSGVTYYIPSTVTLYGKTTIEGGAVIKPDWYSGGSLQVIGTLDCKASPYFPAIFTSVDDDSVGEGLGFSDYDGPPQMANNGVPYLDLTYAQSNCCISNLRFCYADWGVTTPVYSRKLDVWDSQFMQCDYGIINLAAGTGAKDSLHNVLFAACNAAVGASTNAIDIDAEQVTADVGDFCAANSTPDKIALTNSIVWGNDVTASSLSTVNTSFNPDNTNFVAADSGIYYLAANSSLHHSGTASISSRLQTELKGKTTYAPLVIPAYTTISGQMTLAPQVARYTNGAPDLGYHYDALDYTVGMLVLNGGTVSILPGTAIGLRNEYVPSANAYTWWGFWLQQNSALSSQGMPNKPIIYSDVQLVQEQTTSPCIASFVPDFEPVAPGVSPPSMNFRFCQFYAVNAWYHVWSGYNEYLSYEPSPDSLMNWTMRDCALHGGKVNLGLPDDGSFFGASPDYVYGSGTVSWVNNSFENVNFNLDPTAYWYDGTVNCNMPIYAYNNLFKGGTAFLLEPAPTSVGNWTFEDNLFDKTDFLQDTNSPLDFDHNGYWPLLQREYYQLGLSLTSSGDAGQLMPSAGGTLNGANEVTLSGAPPYQKSVFGNFYLASANALYQAGSRTASDAGLSQYTTFTSQARDTANQPVNIGVHYVAAASSLPIDTDGDGIPDYVEVEHGTDPANSMSDGVTNDIYNAAYDDVDLSGSGLVGRIKRVLGINPLDNSNPLIATQIITGEEPEIATFEVPISYSSLTNFGTLRLLVDGGGAASYQECDAAADGNSLLEWNTSFDSPGQHFTQVQLVLNGNQKSGPTPDSSVLKGSGIVGAFLSTNICQFDAFYSEYTDNGATLYAKVPACPNANYSIEIKTTSGQHIKTITGNTSTGEINDNWDLTDDNGNTVTNEDVNAVFNVTLLDPGSGTLTFPMHHVSSDIWDDGNFTIAYAWDNSYQAQHSMHDAIQYSVVDTLISPLESGGSGSENPYNSTFNDFSWSGNLNGNPGWLSSPTVVSSLTNNLADPDTRNFYFDGHGSINSIGDSQSPTNPASITVTTFQVADLLHNKIGKTSWCMHPYRFVFLNACDTAGANFWAHSFGIKDKITYAQASQRGSTQAFMGWFNESRGPNTDDEWNDEAQTYAVFFGAWMSGWPLENCYRVASSPFPQAPFDYYYLNFPFGIDWPWYEYAAPIIYGHVIPYHIKIFGYAGITRSGFEYGYDNSPYYQ